MSTETDRIISALREGWPGIVEEWELQKADGNEDWPDYHDGAGLAWWLYSEVNLIGAFIPGDETSQEQKLQAFCITALRYLWEGADEPAEYA